MNAAFLLFLNRLGQVLRNELCHFEHRNLRFTEDGLQVRVGVDVASVLLILKIILLDISPQLPQLLNNFRAGQRFGSDHFAKRFARL
jgi:hypothetical protein